MMHVSLTGLICKEKFANRIIQLGLAIKGVNGICDEEMAQSHEIQIKMKINLEILQHNFILEAVCWNCLKRNRFHYLEMVEVKSSGLLFLCG